MTSNLLTDTMGLKELVEYIKSELPNFYGSIEHQPAFETLKELHDLVACNEPYAYDQDTGFENNQNFESYLHTLYTAIKPKKSYIETLYA